MKRSHLIFDCYGTLLRIPQSTAYQTLAKELGITEADYGAYARKVRTEHLDLKQAYTQYAPTLPFIEIESNFARNLRADVALIEPYPGVIDGLKELSRTYTISILSNLTDGYKTPIQHFLPEYNHFLSCDIGLVKPDPTLYQYVVDQLKTVSEACIFIDDKERNLLTARVAMGFETILADYTAQNPSAYHTFSAINDRITSL